MSNPAENTQVNTSQDVDPAAAAKATLNVNAKSFVPKLEQSDSPAVGRSPAKAPAPPTVLPMPPMPFAPLNPTTLMGLNPLFMAQLAAASSPLMAMRPPSMMTGFPMPHLMTPMAVPPIPMVPTPTAPTPTAPKATPVTPASPNVSVGNASLVAQRSNVPPKFACVLLVGVTGVGKTTVGRQLVNELNEDRMGWAFFSGGDHMKDTPSRPAPWETTKLVLDALAQTLDGLLAKQVTSPIRGLIIDKQCRGVEDLYYLTSMLRQRGLLLWGIIGLDVPNDDVLCARLGASDGIREKIKYHRVIESRIADAAKSVHLWRSVDASAPKQDVVRTLRTMALGCSSQSPTKQLQASSYHESTSAFVDNYTTYGQVMTTLFTCHKPSTKGYTFPGSTNVVPLPAALLEERKRNTTLRDYVVRRKVDGTKYVLLYDSAKLYLIPRHMRCVFEMPLEAWLGVPLASMGRFILDGDLVKMTKERLKEKFVVYDVVFLAEKGSLVNLVTRATWKERQERLKVNLCSETTAFFPKKGEVVVVHQISEELRNIPALLEPCDYPSDGLILQPTVRREDPVYAWRPPESITVDFRLGAMTSNEDGTRRTFQLEAFDQKAGRYVPFRDDTVEVGGSRPQALEGAIAVCGLELVGDVAKWVFLRTRCDVQIAAMKSAVEELLHDCLITKKAMLAAFGTPEPPASAAPGKAAATPQLGTASQPPAVVVAPMANRAMPPANSGVTDATRLAFGSALPSAAPSSPPPRPQNEGLLTDAQKLSQLSVPVKVQQVPASGQNTIAALESLLLGGKVTVSREDPARSQPTSNYRQRNPRNDRGERDRSDRVERSERNDRGERSDGRRHDRRDHEEDAEHDSRHRRDNRGTRAGRSRRHRDDRDESGGAIEAASTPASAPAPAPQVASA